jgi:hypothetical protein
MAGGLAVILTIGHAISQASLGEDGFYSIVNSVYLSAHVCVTHIISFESADIFSLNLPQTSCHEVISPL